MTISILDQAIKAGKTLLAGIQEGGSALFKNVYEKGDVLDRTQLPYAVLHLSEEFKDDDSSTKVYLSVPFLIEVEFGRPDGGSPTPAERHRELLKILQKEIAADPTLGERGVTDVLYNGRGSRLEPTDAEDPSFRFAFLAEWLMRYRYKMTDPTMS